MTTETNNLLLKAENEIMSLQRKLEREALKDVGLVSFEQTTQGLQITVEQFIPINTDSKVANKIFASRLEEAKAKTSAILAVK